MLKYARILDATSHFTRSHDPAAGSRPWPVRQVCRAAARVYNTGGRSAHFENVRGLSPTQQHHCHRRFIPNNVSWKLICNKGCHIFHEREDFNSGTRRGSTMTIITSCWKVGNDLTV